VGADVEAKIQHIAEWIAESASLLAGCDLGWLWVDFEFHRLLAQLHFCNYGTILYGTALHKTYFYLLRPAMPQ
jgi:hypothetical protein